MNDRRTSYLFLALAVAVLLGLFYWMYQRDEAQFDWRDNWVKNAYSESSDQPYGTQILHRLLGNYFPNHRLRDLKKNVAQELPLDSSGRSNYFFVGEGLYLDSLSTARLLAFVEAGNTALLSSKTIPFDLMFHLYFEECEEAEWNDYEMFSDSTAVPAWLEEPAVAGTFGYRWRNRPRPYNWSFIESYFFCDSLPQRPLGYIGDTLINFAEFPYGRGRFLLHTTPIILSNYHLLRPASHSYTEGVLSYLQEGDIYWDACSRVPEAVSRRRNMSRGYSRQLEAEHPFSYILQQKALAWAWYLILGLALLFVIFRAKRRQRVIPVLAKNENSSYEFISTIANLHFREKNYQNLCIRIMRLFLGQIRERYGLMAQLDAETFHPRVDAAFASRLAQVAEVPVQRVNQIFEQYRATVQFDPTEDMMVALHLAVEDFFKQAK